MKDHLARASFRIEKEFVTRIGNGSLPCYLSCPEYHLGDDTPVLLCKIVDAANMSCGHDEQMDRGSGVDIVEDDDILIAVKNIGVPLPSHDLAEDTLFFRQSPRLSNTCNQ